MHVVAERLEAAWEPVGIGLQLARLGVARGQLLLPAVVLRGAGVRGWGNAMGRGGMSWQ